MSDLINRQAAIDAVETKIKKWNAVDGEGYHVGLGLRYTDVISTLTELPSAQPEEASVILGASKDGVRLWYKCSVCGEPVNADDNYCCNCGRKFINGRFDR